MATKSPNNPEEAYIDSKRLLTIARLNPVRALLLVGVLTTLPIILTNTGNDYWITLLVELFVFGIAVLSFDLLFGYTGLLSFGHALFFGMGTYIVAIVARETGLNYLGAIPLALVGVPLLALGVGIVALRLEGVYFAILMLAFGQLGYQIIVQLTNLTGGVNGISGLEIPSILGFDPTSAYTAYYVTLFILAVVYVALRRVVNSPFGHVLQGINQNEERMEMMGINVYRYKLASFVLAGSVGGLAGLLYPLYLNFVDPSLLNWTTTGDMLMMTLIGGLGTLWGPLLGAGFYIMVQGGLESVTEQWRIVLGLIFVLFVLVFPTGIAGLFGNESTAAKKLRDVRNQLLDTIGLEGSRDE